MFELTKRHTGNYYEQKAHDFLQHKGYTCLTRNFVSRFGEIDLIFTHDELLLFVEVRARASSQYGSASESVGRIKQRKIKQTAQHFVKVHPHFQYYYWRFDVIGFDSGKMNWIQNAFG